MKSRTNKFLELHQQGWIALANQKSYFSVYTCMADHIAAFKQHHPSNKTGSGGINIRERDEVPREDLGPVISNPLEYRP